MYGGILLGQGRIEGGSYQQRVLEQTVLLLFRGSVGTLVGSELG